MFWWNIAQNKSKHKQLFGWLTSKNINVKKREIEKSDEKEWQNLYFRFQSVDPLDRRRSEFMKYSENIVQIYILISGEITEANLPSAALKKLLWKMRRKRWLNYEIVSFTGGGF
jgi:hypothetical protein